MTPFRYVSFNANITKTKLEIELKNQLMYRINDFWFLTNFGIKMECQNLNVFRVSTQLLPFENRLKLHQKDLSIQVQCKDNTEFVNM